MNSYSDTFRTVTNLFNAVVDSKLADGYDNADATHFAVGYVLAELASHVAMSSKKDYTKSMTVLQSLTNSYTGTTNV